MLKKIRKNYDKLLHITTSALLTIILMGFIESYFTAGAIIFFLGLAWEFINLLRFDVKPSMADVMANMMGILIGFGVFALIEWRLLCW